MNRPKLLFFFSSPPLPARSGLDKRVLELLSAFRELGCETTLLGSFSPQQSNPWTAPVIDALKKDYVNDVRLYGFHRWRDDPFTLLIRVFHRLSRRPYRFNTQRYTPPGLRAWYRRQFAELSPDLALIVFVRWDALLRGVPRARERRIIETIDLLSLNMAMWGAAQPRLPARGTASVDPDLLREDFYDRLQLGPDDEEFAAYDRYDYTVVISQTEADQISARTHDTRVLYVPMSVQVVDHENTYDGPAVFPTGPNPFNEQACHYFVQRVLPSLRRQAPDFHLLLTGSCSDVTPPSEGVEPCGFVPDLAELYRRAPFLICPVYGGTGQLVKVMEAMAHGVPAIVLEAARHRTIIRHGDDGLIARDADEFAAFAAQLWHDRARCRKLGQAARARVAAEYSHERLVSQLRKIVEGERPEAKA